MEKSRAQCILDRYDKMRRDKQQWLTMWSMVAEYVHSRKYPFIQVAGTSMGVTAPWLLDQVFDKTAGQANRLMASSLIGALWPNGAKTFELALPTSKENTEADTLEVREYFEWATKTMVEKMDHPRAGLLTSLEEYMTDQGAFGTSGMSVSENENDWEVPVQYNSVDVKRIAIDEGENGFVDTVYNEIELTIRQAVMRYGLENLAPKTRERFENGDGDEKIFILHAIEPRMDVGPYAFGAKALPIASIHIEIEHKYIIKESGYEEMRVFVTRFWKDINQKYGTSPGIEAMADILEINAMREAAEVAIEKSLDPPIMVLDDGALGGGVLDTSAGAVTVRTVSGRLGNQKPVEPLYEVGELNATYARITELKEDIKNTFFVDRLLDLNNEQRMTAYETSIRDGLRGQSLGTIYSRQLAELFTPLISATFNILFNRGILGVVEGSSLDKELMKKGVTPRYIPQAVADMITNGEDPYQIRFISPAARIMQNEEMLGIQKVSEFILSMAPMTPKILDLYDEDFAARRIQELSGAPVGLLRSIEEVRRKRAKDEMMQQAAMQLEAQRQNSETARNMSQALGTAAQANIMPNDQDVAEGEAA